MSWFVVMWLCEFIGSAVVFDTTSRLVFLTTAYIERTHRAHCAQLFLGMCGVCEQQMWYGQALGTGDVGIRSQVTLWCVRCV